MGPVEVLLPYLVKNELGGSARDLGIVLGAGGLGSVACAIAMGRRDIPRRGITFIYVAWTLATLAVVGYGLSSALWQLMLAALAFNALETAGTIVWATLKQRHVPRAMLGRVSSLDWLISIGLLPLSFALTGPVAAAIGTRGTLVGGRDRGRARHLRGLLRARHARHRARAREPGASRRARRGRGGLALEEPFSRARPFRFARRMARPSNGAARRRSRSVRPRSRSFIRAPRRAPLPRYR